MQSPFPGMDPYLERHWRDVHATLIVLSRAALQAQLGGGLRARIEERLIIETPLDDAREIYPDVRVFERGLQDRPIAPASSGAAVAEPLVIRRAAKVAQRFIQIIDVASGGKLVTVIEFVSPSNKLPGDARDKFIQKRDEVIAADVNWVEVDLTRAGRREPAYPVSNLSSEYRTAYLACAFRAGGDGQYELYRIPLRERLPAIRIPLRANDPDIILELQPLLQQAYIEGAYDDIDYSKPSVPPLEADDAAWAETLLSAAGKR